MHSLLARQRPTQRSRLGILTPGPAAGITCHLSRTPLSGKSERSFSEITFHFVIKNHLNGDPRRRKQASQVTRRVSCPVVRGSLGQPQQLQTLMSNSPWTFRFGLKSFGSGFRFALPGFLWPSFCCCFYAAICALHFLKPKAHWTLAKLPKRMAGNPTGRSERSVKLKRKYHLAGL